MKQVELLSNTFDVQFKHDGKQFDSIQYQRSSIGRIYFSAISNGIRYRTIAKQIQFDDEYNVYITFGKTKLIVGSYKEVA